MCVAPHAVLEIRFREEIKETNVSSDRLGETAAKTIEPSGSFQALERASMAVGEHEPEDAFISSSR